MTHSRVGKLALTALEYNNGKSASKISDQFMTPPNVIELARTAMGSIDFDPASNYVAQQYVKAKEYCIDPSDEDSMLYATGVRHANGLTRQWHGNVWLNPPYSNGNIDAFVDKAIEEWTTVRLLGSPYFTVDSMIILVNSSTDTKWYHKLCKHASFGLMWSGRIKFWKIFDGKAHDKWEGELSKQRGTGKVGNAPRFLNTLFFFARTNKAENSMYNTFEGKGTFFKTL